MLPANFAAGLAVVFQPPVNNYLSDIFTHLGRKSSGGRIIRISPSIALAGNKCVVTHLLLPSKTVILMFASEILPLF
jgi:hypothetical protein